VFSKSFYLDTASTLDCCRYSRLGRLERVDIQASGWLGGLVQAPFRAASATLRTPGSARRCSALRGQLIRKQPLLVLLLRAVSAIVLGSRRSERLISNQDQFHGMVKVEAPRFKVRGCRQSVPLARVTVSPTCASLTARCTPELERLRRGCGHNARNEAGRSRRHGTRSRRAGKHGRLVGMPC